MLFLLGPAAHTKSGPALVVCEGGMPMGRHDVALAHSEKTHKFHNVSDDSALSVQQSAGKAGDPRAWRGCSSREEISCSRAAAEVEVGGAGTQTGSPPVLQHYSAKHVDVIDYNIFTFSDHV